MTWHKVSPYTGLSINFKMHYQDGIHTVSYYERSIWIDGANFEPLPIHDLAHWRKESERVDGLKESIRSLQSELNAIQYVIEGR